LCWLLWACAAEPELPELPELPTVSKADANAAAVALVDGATSVEPAAPIGVAAGAPGGEPVEVVLAWEGISSLYRSFFSRSEAITSLSASLGGQVTGPANVHIRYDSAAFLGQIQLQLRPGTRLVPVGHGGDRIQLQDLHSLTEPLAAYRADLSARFDVRIASFRVGIEAHRGATVCRFGIAGGPPAGGRVVSPCVEINGIEACGKATPTGILFSPKDARAIEICLDL
jgi:hypothetical protein